MASKKSLQENNCQALSYWLIFLNENLLKIYPFEEIKKKLWLI